MTEQQVAFFRNLNLGQGLSPRREQLLAAFERAGAPGAMSFQVNGTVAFDPGDSEPQAVGNAAVAALTSMTGYAEVAVVRSVAELRMLDLTAGDEVAFFDGPDAFPEALPWTDPRGDLILVHATHRLAIARNSLERRSGATRSLERLLGVPVTSRATSTIARLLVRMD